MIPVVGRLHTVFSAAIPFHFWKKIKVLYRKTNLLISGKKYPRIRVVSLWYVRMDILPYNFQIPFSDTSMILLARGKW